jgi:hypothetical protein
MGSIDPTYCGGKEIFKKSYEVVIHLEKRAKNVGATGIIRTLFAPANKDGVDKYAKEFEYRFNQRETPSAMLPALVSQFAEATEVDARAARPYQR